MSAQPRPSTSSRPKQSQLPQQLLKLVIPQFRIPTPAQIFALSASVIIAYIWLSIPFFKQYALQAFAGCILFYFILKKLNDAKIWEILPATAIDEMTLTIFAFLIAIGATGGTTSLIYPLVFVLLFFISMTTSFATAITISLELILFFYALSPNPELINIPNLFSIPLVMTFFLFAKYQYLQAKQNQTLVEIENNTIHHYQISLEDKDSELTHTKQNSRLASSLTINFIKKFLQPKLNSMQQMLNFQDNKQAIKGQLTIINIQLEKLLQQLKTGTDQE